MSILGIDDWIMDRAQIVADTIHDFTGLDCIQQTRLLSGVLAVIWLLVVATELRTDRRFDALAALCLISHFQEAMWESNMDMVARSGSITGARNPRRAMVAMKILRLLVLLLLPFVIVRKLMAHNPFLMMPLVYWVYLHFGACDVRRPKPGKIRDRVSDFGRALRQGPLVPATEVVRD